MAERENDAYIEKRNSNASLISTLFISLKKSKKCSPLKFLPLIQSFDFQGKSPQDCLLRVFAACEYFF